MVDVEFNDDMFKPANVRQPAGRPEDQAKAIDALDGLTGRASEAGSARTELRGRQDPGAEKPALVRGDNFPSGPSGYALIPNTGPRPEGLARPDDEQDEVVE